MIVFELTMPNYVVRVEGEGVNKKTGEKILFITIQTGL